MHPVVKRRLSLAIMCATILLSSFLISIVYSAQNVSFGLHKDIGMKWEGGNVKISVPFYVRNYGIYNIEDVNIILELRDNTGRVLTRSVNYIGTIRAGSELNDYINFTFQPVSLFLEVLLHQILQNRTMELRATAFLNYALSWLTLEAEASIPLTPQLLAKELFQSVANYVSLDFNKPNIQLANESFTFSIPFSINHTSPFRIENFELSLKAESQTNDLIGLWHIKMKELKQGENRGWLNISLDKEFATQGLSSVNAFTIHLKGEINGFAFEWSKTVPYNHTKR
jgi:hypothetical protein